MAIHEEQLMAFVHIGGQGVWIDDDSADFHPRCMLYCLTPLAVMLLSDSLPGLADLQLAPLGFNKTHAMHIANFIIVGVFVINIVLMDVKIILAKSIEVRVIEVRGLAPVATWSIRLGGIIEREIYQHFPCRGKLTRAIHTSIGIVGIITTMCFACSFVPSILDCTSSD